VKTKKPILERARSGLLSRSEVDAVAHDLECAEGGLDPYTAIHILGLVRAVEHERIIAGFLENPDDPMLARISLEVLGSYWTMGGRYRHEIERFSRGVEWDRDEDVRLIAISLAGETLRAGPDQVFLHLLVTILRSASERPIVRQAAYFALARASGRNWNELPSAAVSLDFDKDVDSQVLRWVSEQMGGSIS
jgi:hypothetical protein